MRSRLLKFARSHTGGKLLHLFLRVAPGLLPVHHLHYNGRVLAFRHPAPFYPLHVLLIPLPPLGGLQALTVEDGALLAEVLRVAKELAQALCLPEGWKLVVNGGAFQDVPILHFHLIAEQSPCQPNTPTVSRKIN